MWLTPAWQTAVAILSGIFALVVVPTMLDAKIPSTNYTIPQYTHDAILRYWPPPTNFTPFNNSTSEVSTAISTTASYHPANSSKPFFNPTAVELDSFEATELPLEASDNRLEYLVHPSTDEECLPRALQWVCDAWTWWLLPGLGVFAVAVVSLYCVWSTVKSIRIKQNAPASTSLVQTFQTAIPTTSQPAALLVPGVLNAEGNMTKYVGQEFPIPNVSKEPAVNKTSRLSAGISKRSATKEHNAIPVTPPNSPSDTMDAQLFDRHSLPNDTPLNAPPLNATPQPLATSKGRNRPVKVHNTKAAKAKARQYKAIANIHRAACQRACESVLAKMVLGGSKILSNGHSSNLREMIDQLDEYKKQCDSAMAEGLALTKQNAKDFYNRTSEMITSLNDATTGAAKDLEESIEKTHSDRANQQDTQIASFASDVDKLRKIWEELDEIIKTHGGSLGRAVWRLDELDKKFKDVIRRIKELDAAFETTFNVKLSYFKDNVIQPQLDSYKNETASAIAAAVELSAVSASAFEERIAGLEKICKDLATDKSSKDSQINDLQDAQRKMSARIASKDIEIKALKLKFQDDVRDCANTQQSKLQDLANKLDPWKYGMERFINDQSGQIEQTKVLVKSLHSSLGKTETSLNGLQDTVTNVELRTAACEKGLGEFSPLQDILVKVGNKLDTVAKQVESIKTKDLPKFREQQTSLLDGLNGVRAEVQRLTGTKPKQKRQRVKPHWAAASTSHSGDEDNAKPDSQTPPADRSPESLSEKLPESPPTSPESNGAGPKDTSSHQPPEQPSSSVDDTPKQDPDIQGDRNCKEETKSPPLDSPNNQQSPLPDPEAVLNPTGDAYYDILGVQFDATPAVIRKAYKTRAKMLHPDKNPHRDTAQEDFTLLSEAHYVLSDSIQRGAYDQARINCTPYTPVPAHSGFIFDPTPQQPAFVPIATEIIRQGLEKRISEKIDELKKAPGGWRLSSMTARPIALEQLVNEEPDQPWPAS